MQNWNLVGGRETSQKKYIKNQWPRYFLINERHQTTDSRSSENSKKDTLLFSSPKIFKLQNTKIKKILKAARRWKTHYLQRH